MDNYSVVFVIAHKYHPDFPSYIQYYADNIQKLYSNSLILIVDNSSKHIDVIKEKLSNYNNLIIIENTDECRYELGAYKFGIKYLINNNLIDKYDYFMFTQDTFVLKYKYNFDDLKTNNIHASTVYYQTYGDLAQDIYEQTLKDINLYDTINKSTFCCCCSFVLQKYKVEEFLNITKNIIVKTKNDAFATERYLSNILYHLNDNRNSDIQGHSGHIPNYYDLFNKDIIYQDTPPQHYFVKHIGYFYNQKKWDENNVDNN